MIYTYFMINLNFKFSINEEIKRVVYTINKIDWYNKQGYKEIIAGAKKKKYEVKILNLQIKGKLLSDLTEKAVKKIGTDMNCVIFGFSMGALIAYNVSTILPVKKIILASTSPALGPDIKTIWKQMVREKYFGVKTVAEFREMKYRKTKAEDACFMYGEKETGVNDFLISRTKKLYKSKIGKKELVMIKDNNHRLTPEYVAEIIKRL